MTYVLFFLRVLAPLISERYQLSFLFRVFSFTLKWLSHAHHLPVVGLLVRRELSHLNTKLS
jgi:hypothetical protein